mmetsp:Transcript_47309/g.107309  ORF Transcript_47309/g.107309 Transcript_47309/m.107309 type:complete len:227 (-) Transcript_47309:7-687(-)
MMQGRIAIYVHSTDIGPCAHQEIHHAETAEGGSLMQWRALLLIVAGEGRVGRDKELGHLHLIDFGGTVQSSGAAAVHGVGVRMCGQEHGGDGRVVIGPPQGGLVFPVCDVRVRTGIQQVLRDAVLPAVSRPVQRHLPIRIPFIQVGLTRDQQLDNVLAASICSLVQRPHLQVDLFLRIFLSGHRRRADDELGGGVLLPPAAVEQHRPHGLKPEFYRARKRLSRKIP